MKLNHIILALVPFTAACLAPKVAINPKADFSNIHRVAVMNFNGGKGELAADLMTQSLLARGIDVVERQRLNSVTQELRLSNSSSFDPATAKKIGRLLGVDAIFVGTVAENVPAASYIISSGQTSAVYTNVNKVTNSSIYSEGSVMGVPNTQIITSAAKVSLISRMVDIETGSILWSASMSYEGFDASSAMSAITDSFVRSLNPIWPQLSKI